MRFYSARIILYVALTVLMLFTAGIMLLSGCDNTPAVKAGDTIKVEYKGSLEDGTVFDQNQEGQPLEFTVGSGQLIPGFDRAVVGMKLEETKTVTLPAEDAYGMPAPSLIRNFPKTSFPDNFEPEIGMDITMQDQSGRPVPAKIAGITEDEIAIDLNHPLAGKTLVFDIKVIGIQ